MINSFTHVYDFLRNFRNLPVPICLPDDPRPYYNVEAAFQAAKLEDPAERHIFAGLNGAEAKKLGRTVQLRPNWDEGYVEDKEWKLPFKLTIMHTLVWRKFNNNPAMMQALIATEDALLVEGNTWLDNFWGSCTCDRCHCKEKYNYLGKIPMAVRAEMGGATGSICENEVDNFKCGKPAKMILMDDGFTHWCEDCNKMLQLEAKECECWDCWQRPVCEFAWDPYNIDGDCIANK